MFRRLPSINFFNPQSRLLSMAAIMFFFFALFNGMLAYVLPIRITDLGFSTSQMGLILASSNVFGAIFDFFLAGIIKNTNYRRLFLITYGLCFIYPLILWSSKTLPLFMISMAIWGLYGDLHLYATFDFVSRRSHFGDHCKSFGILGIFKSLGYLIAPIIAGVIVVGAIDFLPFSLSISFILITFIFYLMLIQFSPKKESPQYDHTPNYRRYNFFSEFFVLAKVARVLWPVLVFSVVIYIFDSTFWTIGPILAEQFPDFRGFGAYFMAAYTLPVLIVNWFINPIVHKFGKKKTAYISFLLGCICLVPLAWVKEPVTIIGLVFISSVLGSIAWPAIDGAFSDYISESMAYDKEIEGLSDFTCNIGYIIGPIFAGFMAEFVGNRNVFPVMGIFTGIAVVWLLMVTPKHIKVRVLS